MQCQIEDESNLLYCYQVRNCPFSCHYSQLQHTCKCIKGNLEEETRKTMKMRLGRKTLLKNSQVEEGGSTLHFHVIFMLCFISKPCQLNIFFSWWYVETRHFDTLVQIDFNKWFQIKKGIAALLSITSAGLLFTVAMVTDSLSALVSYIPLFIIESDWDAARPEKVLYGKKGVVFR